MMLCFSADVESGLQILVPESALDQWQFNIYVNSVPRIVFLVRTVSLSFLELLLSINIGIHRHDIAWISTVSLPVNICVDPRAGRERWIMWTGWFRSAGLENRLHANSWGLREKSIEAVKREKIQDD
jgi:hypothetical protein